MNEVSSIAKLGARSRRLIESGIAQRVLVVDGGSNDGTREAVDAEDCMDFLDASLYFPHGVNGGKGANIAAGLRSLDSATGVVLLLDADVDFDEPDRLAELVEASRHSVLAKAAFRRRSNDRLALPGGRVTDLVARPLLRRLRPQLADLEQPLSGQMAVRLSEARRLRYVNHYGVDISMLISASDHGPVIEVDVGVLSNGPKPDADLVPIAQDVVDAIGLLTESFELSGSRISEIYPFGQDPLGP